MKKITAIILALGFVFSLAACGSDKAEQETTEPSASVQDEATTAVDATAQDTVTTAQNEEDSTDGMTESVTSDTVTSVSDETSSQTTVASDGSLDLNDKQAVLDYYNAAVKRTNPDKPKGRQDMSLSKDIDGDGVIIGTVAKIFTPIAKVVLKNNSVETSHVPGEGNLRLSDCESISATSKNGVITVNIKLKSQVDGSDGDPKNGGPIARGIGTLGSIDIAVSQLGFNLDSGRETIKLTYNKSSISATINEKTGKITSGTWKYSVDIFAGDVYATYEGFTAHIVNLTAGVDFSITI